MNLWVQGNGKDVVIKVSWDLGTRKGARPCRALSQGMEPGRGQAAPAEQQTLVTTLIFFRKFFWAAFS